MSGELEQITGILRATKANQPYALGDPLSLEFYFPRAEKRAPDSSTWVSVHSMEESTFLRVGWTFHREGAVLSPMPPHHLATTSKRGSNKQKHRIRLDFQPSHMADMHKLLTPATLELFIPRRLRGFVTDDALPRTAVWFPL